MRCGSAHEGLPHEARKINPGREVVREAAVIGPDGNVASVWVPGGA
eukprot:COSAG04_NODE_17677_length_462_cov_0.966942_1_plen_45_part_10